MLHAKRKSDGRTVIASPELDPSAVFLCPQCSERVIVRTSVHRRIHFAHKIYVNCDFTVGETNAHRACKQAIYEGLLQQPGVTDVAMERPFPPARPDVSAVIDGVRVAIEVQISSLSVETISRRTAEYAQLGIYVLWLCQWTPALDGIRYNPSLWEKWLHAAYFGHVYYWTEGLSIAAYHFDPYFTRVPPKKWFSTGGKEMRGGGFSQRSERFRTPVHGKTLNIATDLVPKEREWWRGGEFTIPSAKLFIERGATSPSKERTSF